MDQAAGSAARDRGQGSGIRGQNPQFRKSQISNLQISNLQICKSRISESTRPYLLRNRHRDGIGSFSPPRGGCRRAGSRPGGPPRLDQRLLPLRVDHHQHQLRPYEAIGRHLGGHRGGEGRHHQAGRAGHQRRCCGRAERSDSPHRTGRTAAGWSNWVSISASIIIRRVIWSGRRRRRGSTSIWKAATIGRRTRAHRDQRSRLYNHRDRSLGPPSSGQRRRGAGGGGRTAAKRLDDPRGRDPPRTGRGRLAGAVEVVARRPTVVLDAAHNVASIAALVEVLDESFSAGRRLLVFATTQEKDLRGMLQRLLGRFDHVIFTRYSNNPRSVPPQELLSWRRASVGVAVQQSPLSRPTFGRCPERGRG